MPKRSFSATACAVATAITLSVGLPSVALAAKYCTYAAVREVWVSTSDHKLKAVLLRDGVEMTRVIATYTVDVRANAELDHKLSLLTSALLAGKALELRYPNGYDCNLPTDETTEPYVVILRQ